MLEAKTVAQPILRSCGLVLGAIGGIVVNVVEITVVGMVLAGISMLAVHNIQFFREHQFLLTPLVFMLAIVMFLVLALPGFFTVIFISRFAGRNRSLGAIILAVTGAIVWLGFSALIITLHGEHGESNYWPSNWVILPGLVSNVVGQIWAAILIRRRRVINSGL